MMKANIVGHSIWLLLTIGFVFCNDIKIERLPSPRSLCGEGPHWDVASQSLYYIDIYGPESTLLRYDFNENKTYAATVDNEPLMTFVLPLQDTDDQFLVGTKNEAKIIRWDGKSSKGQLVRTAFKIEEGTYLETNRFNDAKCDASGRFFGGTQRLSECNGPFNVANASFYNYDREHGVRQLKKDVLISNGLTWNKNKFYYIDSCSYDIKQFDYNIDTGELSNEQVYLSLEKLHGKKPDYVFDGMTSDNDGNLFIATYGGHKVMKVHPTNGEVLAEYQIPSVNQVTSVAFGGPNMDVLFVTTASRENQPAEAGYLYKITGLNSTGSPGVKVRL